MLLCHKKSVETFASYAEKVDYHANGTCTPFRVDFRLHMCTPMGNEAGVCACLPEHRISF